MITTLYILFSSFIIISNKKSQEKQEDKGERVLFKGLKRWNDY